MTPERLRTIPLIVRMLLLGAVSGARATPVTGGATTVTLTDDFLDLGVTFSALGAATLAPPDVTFPITGGDADETTLAGMIEHDGSGISVTDGTSVLNLENLLIDTIAGVIFADVSIDGSDQGQVPLFAIGPGLELTLSIPARVAITSTFGLDTDDLDFTVGTASVNLEFDGDAAPVPEPSSWLLLSSGFASLAFGSRRARSARR